MNIEQADEIYYYYVFGCLAVVLTIVIIDLWCCVSGAKLSNEPYYLLQYIENEKKKAEEEKTKKKNKIQEKQKSEKEKEKENQLLAKKATSVWGSKVANEGGEQDDNFNKIE